MLDWEFSDELDDVSDVSAEQEAPLCRSWRFWLVISLAVIAIGAAGTVGVRWWLATREDAMREDIRAAIEQEEQARSFGLDERASDFVGPDISRTWWDAYRRTFRWRRNHTPVDLTLEDVTFDGADALVVVQLDGYAQLRRYRLAGQEWRRTQLSDDLWSGERQIQQITDDNHLLFRPRDREFAEELARDLPALLDTMESWPDGGPRFHQIEILANELQPALISAGNVRIKINSPLLVPHDGRLGGEAAVRFALASTLTWQNTSVVDDLQPLPGGTRMLGAVKTITALHWALTEEEQARFREGWRSRLDGEWASPLFTEMLLSNAEPSADQVHAEFAALLTADYVYSIGGSEAIAGLLVGMTQSDSWDEVLQLAIDRNTITLEREAAAYARGETAQRVNIPDTATALPAIGMLQPEFRDGHLTLAAAGNEESILIDTSAAPRLHTPEGTPLTLNCIGSGSTIRADGEWLEAGRRLAAHDIVVTDPVPPVPLAGSAAAPTDTIAYLTDSSAAAPVSISALRADHTQMPLLNAANARNLHLQPGDDGIRFYFFYYPENCSRSWLIEYEPASGHVAGWLMRPAAPTDPDLWKPEYLRARGTILLIGTVLPDNTHRYRLLDPTAPFDLEPALEMNLNATPLGWSEALDQVVVVGGDAAADRIGVTALDERAIHWFDKPIPSLRFTSLSRSGRWFVYSHLNDRQDEVLRLFDLTTGELQTLQTLAPGEDIAAGSWSLSYEDERLVLLIGEKTQRWVSGRMVVIDPHAPQQTTVTAESNGNVWFQNPVLCADGRLFYRRVSVDPNENSVWLMLRESAGAEPIRLHDDRQARVIACE